MYARMFLSGMGHSAGQSNVYSGNEIDWATKLLPSLAQDKNNLFTCPMQSDLGFLLVC